MHLHLYDDLRDVPAGVTVIDGNATVPRDFIMRLRYRHNDSLALAGNYFRLALQHQGKGMWVDTDMVCIAPFPADDHLYGWETDDSINNAVLRLPGAIPIEGGLPLMAGGKIVGAIGVSGVQSNQDGQVAKAGAGEFQKIAGQ